MSNYAVLKGGRKIKCFHAEHLHLYTTLNFLQGLDIFIPKYSLPSKEVYCLQKVKNQLF